MHKGETLYPSLYRHEDSGRLTEKNRTLHIHILYIHKGGGEMDNERYRL